MDIVDYLIVNIAPLPWTVKGPGLFLIMLLFFRAVGQVLSLRWITAVTSVLTAMIIALIMARFGWEIEGLITTYLNVPPAENSGNAS